MTDLINDLLPPLGEKETFSRPGTADVTPSDAKKVAPLAKHFLGMAHPFTSCVRAQVKHGLSEDHAKRRCAVLLDKFDPKRERHSRVKEDDVVAVVEEAGEQLREFASVIGPVNLARIAMGQGGPGVPAELDSAIATAAAIVEAFGPVRRSVTESDAPSWSPGVLSPVAPLAESLPTRVDWNPADHPRDRVGRFTEKLKGIGKGDTVTFPDDVKVHRTLDDAGFIVRGGSQGTAMSRGEFPQFVTKDPKAAAKDALNRSARSSRYGALGGHRSYDSLEDFEKTERKPAARGMTAKQLDAIAVGLLPIPGSPEAAAEREVAATIRQRLLDTQGRERAVVQQAVDHMEALRRAGRLSQLGGRALTDLAGRGYRPAQWSDLP